MAVALLSLVCACVIKKERNQANVCRVFIKTVENLNTNCSPQATLAIHKRKTFEDVYFNDPNSSYLF